MQLVYTDTTLDVLTDFLGKSQKRVVLFALSSPTLAFVCEGESTPTFYNLERASVSTPWAEGGEWRLGTISALDISPCGRYVVTAHGKGGVALWDAQLGVPVTTVSGQKLSTVFRVAIQPGCETMLAATEGGILTPLRLKTIMHYTTVSPGNPLSINRKIVDVRAPSSCESMRRLFVVCLESKVMVFELGEKQLQRVCELSFDHPHVALYSVGWWSYMAVASGNTVNVVKVGGPEQFTLSWDEPVRDVVILRPGLVGILVGSQFVVHEVSGNKVAEVDVGSNCTGVCACNGKVALIDTGKMLVFDNWREAMERLRTTGKLLEVVTLGMNLYLGKSSTFYCPLEQRKELQKLVLACVEELLKQGSDDPAQFLEIAEAVVKMELSHQVISAKSTAQGRKPLLMALLEVSSWRCDITASILKGLQDDIANLDKAALEQKLMNVVLPPSLTDRVLGIAKKFNMYHFMLHHFHTIHNTITPGFAWAIEHADPAGITQVCERVFITGKFSKGEVDQCIVWLFANDDLIDGTYKRLMKCFEANWEFAATYFKVFLDHAPITFSHSQSITRKDMVAVGLWCFATAPKDYGEPLFELLAKEALSGDVEIPANSIANVMDFVFNSGIERSVRENLLLRIVDVDYKDDIVLGDYAYACVGAGFVSALRRIYKDNIDCESLVTAMLLSDKPEEAFAFLESANDDLRDKGQAAIVTRFRALLFLNARRLVRLVLKSFPDLHPKCVQNMRDTNVVTRYYDALFQEQDFGDNEDSRFYVDYLADHSVESLIKFLRSKEAASDWIYQICESKGLISCCATMDAIRKDWEAAFRHYEEAITKHGAFDKQLCIEIIENITKVNMDALKVIRTLLRPLVHGSQGTQDLEDLLQCTSKHIDPLDGAMALAPLAANCKNKRIRWLLSSHMKCVDCCLTVNSVGEGDMCHALDSIVGRSKGATLVHDSLTASTDDDGVTLLSTCGSPGSGAREMDEETVANVQSVIQRAESLAGQQGKRVPQDQLCQMMIIISSPKKTSVTGGNLARQQRESFSQVEFTML